MDVDDGWIPDETYTACLDRLPQVCVEVVLDTPEGVLLAKRETPPQVWFWPGSRLHKGEALEAAAHRVAREELGVEIDLAERLGVEAHFWGPDETGVDTSRHTVNIVYRATPADDGADITLDAQHSAYRFLDKLDPDLHEYVRAYCTRYDLI